MFHDRRGRHRRASDHVPTEAEHEAVVRAIMEERIRVYLERKGLMDTKQCRRCRNTFAVDLFPKHRGYPDGLDTQCRACHVVTAAESRARRKASLSLVGRSPAVRDMAS